MRFRVGLVVLAVLAVSGAGRFAAQPQAPRRNVVIFVADGLRRGSVNERDMPTLTALRAQGVDFVNSFSLFPTFTMANASAIATGHPLGDTGVFSNYVWPGVTMFATGNFNNAPRTPVPFLENDQVLGELDGQFHGNVLGSSSLLAVARAHGYNTAAIGKLGPAALQDVTAVAPEGGDFPASPESILIDDSTVFGALTAPLPAGSLSFPASLQRRMERSGLPLEAPARTNGYSASSLYSNGYSGDRARSGTLMANVVQQQWFADVATRAVLPEFEGSGKPFALVFWSRDPDGTQHNQGDSLNEVFPGINGPTSLKGLQNADRNLEQLLHWLDEHPAVKANTDVFVTSDHGFATISKRQIDKGGHPSTAASAQHAYVDVNGRVDVERGTLPPGFLAIDLAYDFSFNLYDPDRRVLDAGRTPYRPVRINTTDAWEHPILGNGLLGTLVERLDGADARIIVAANGGSDLVYVPNRNADLVRAVCQRILSYDYVGGVFVDDEFGAVAGTLPMSAIGLVGASDVPRPAIAVAFRTFYLNPDELQSAVQVSDTVLQEGQGMHGGFGRESTLNVMAAIGPDFKRALVDPEPVSNADIAPTLARLMGFDLAPAGSLRGRIISEALIGEPTPIGAPVIRVQESSLAGGARTVVLYEQQAPGGPRYLLAGCRVPQGVKADPLACRQ